MPDFNMTIKRTADLAVLVERLKEVDFDTCWRNSKPINGSSVISLGTRVIGGSPIQRGFVVVEVEPLFPGTLRACTQMASRNNRNPS